MRSEAPWDHVGPGTPGGRLLRTAWQPLYRSCDLRPGRLVRVHALGERFTLWRGRSGRVALLQDRCPHRGTVLAVGDVDGDDLRCHHHGWRFGPDGRCVERPGESDLRDAGSAASHPVREYLGLVFAWLGEGAPPDLPRFRDYEAPGALRVLPPEVWPCGFFQRLENSCDIAHVAWAHRRSGVASAFDGGVEVACEDGPDGLVIACRIAGEPFPPVRFRLPNLLEFQTPIAPEVGWRDHLVWRVPVDDVRCVSFSVALVPASVPNAERYLLDEPLDAPFAPSAIARIGDDVLAGRARLSDLGQENLTEIEDYVALVGQGLPEERPPERLGRADAPVLQLRRSWRRAVSSDEGAS